ncbi:family 20 glycosylhydrolase [Wenyingzhuangia sp. chi5]|uniref:Family 20 glycosylhydrolase n=1 Tax=Wenyingzhuangia gilva TaxID=3057677 RepID=A0ABT8VPP0_9FLAO|nr:family 20 glycosylhydrolase [Wenyingzhuangia sp. chi5]MDO3693927.1 family 20 glycosylhydrolase [Wenyingzhuangia sp. chi5]
MKKIIIIVCCFITLTGYSQQSSDLNLMPWPEHIRLTGQKFVIDKNFKVSINSNKGVALKSTTNFIRRITNKSGVFIEEGFSDVNNNEAQLLVNFNKISNLELSNDESYSLEVKEHQIIINAKTDVGASYALETLIQLLSFNDEYFYFPTLTIKDTPRFKWRGLLIDTARHFQPVEVLKRNLRAMAAVKMNVFHWHLTDDQGFRIETKKLPKLNELGSDGLFYTQEQIKEVVQYAADLGIRVLPEIDVPGHASSILAAYPEIGSKKQAYSIERFSGVFNPTLDPTNEQTYVFLDTLISEVAPLFKDVYFHIGGDENEGKHWDENQKIQGFKKLNNLKTNHDLQTYFNIRLEKILEKYGKKLMGWDEILTPEIPKSALIHSWRGVNEGLPKGGTLIKAAKAGYQTVLSTGFYIDRMESVVKHYQTEPIGNAVLTPEERARILGGEATMWAELATPTTIDSRIWPRTAAIAERLWSPKEVNDVGFMLKRLPAVSVGLEDLGLTHIKNRDLILRNIAKSESIQSLKLLADLSEPLKIYSRNKDGIEYKTFSPFMLFADACVADASEAAYFNYLVQNYLKNPTEECKSKIINQFKVWQLGFVDFSKLKMNPNLMSLQEQYKHVSKVAVYGVSFLNGDKKTLSKKELKQLLKELKKPCVDTELMIVDGLYSLFNIE